MKVCIIDTKGTLTVLKTLFPEASFYTTDLSRVHPTSYEYVFASEEHPELSSLPFVSVCIFQNSTVRIHTSNAEHPFSLDISADPFQRKERRAYLESLLGYRQDTVSLFLTSCNRPALLRKTLESFVRHNTYPIEYGIIVEDSGLQGINDFAHTIVPFPLIVLYAPKRRGQMASIENGLPYLTTKYVFHCEEDWEFYAPGFAEESIRILKKNNTITSVWLRSQQDIRQRYKMPIHPVDDYYLVGPNIGNFSWNPGMRTLEVQLAFTPYASNNLITVCEGGLDKAFRAKGMTSAMTSKVDGYVHHIGWNDHVW
jgi:hypothetical protein